MAEAVFTDTVRRRGLADSFEIDSAGTAGYHIGDSPDPRTIDICRENGVQINHAGRQVNIQDFKKFDYLLCMDMVRWIGNVCFFA